MVVSDVDEHGLIRSGASLGGVVAPVLDQSCVDNRYKKGNIEKKAEVAGGEGCRSGARSVDQDIKAKRQHMPKPNDARFAPEPHEGERVLKGNTQKQGYFRIACLLYTSDAADE